MRYVKIEVESDQSKPSLAASCDGAIREVPLRVNAASASFLCVSADYTITFQLHMALEAPSLINIDHGHSLLGRLPDLSFPYITTELWN